MVGVEIVNFHDVLNELDNVSDEDVDKAFKAIQLGLTARMRSHPTHDAWQYLHLVNNSKHFCQELHRRLEEKYIKSGLSPMKLRVKVIHCAGRPSNYIEAIFERG